MYSLVPSLFLPKSRKVLVYPNKKEGLRLAGGSPTKVLTKIELRDLCRPALHETLISCDAHPRRTSLSPPPSPNKKEGQALACTGFLFLFVAQPSLQTVALPVTMFAYALLAAWRPHGSVLWYDSNIWPLSVLIPVKFITHRARRYSLDSRLPLCTRRVGGTQMIAAE